MRKPLYAACILVLTATTTSWLYGSSPDDTLTPDERELVELMTAYYAELTVFWQESRGIASREDYEAALADGRLVNPNGEYIPRLLEFEEAHRGEEVGLLALRHVFSEAARGGDTANPRAVGRREAVGRLAYYADSAFLPRAVNRSLLGNFEPAAYDAAVALIESADVPPSTRDRLRYLVAQKDLELQGLPRDEIAKRVAELESGAEPRWPGELDRQKAWLEIVPSNADLTRRVAAAIATLEELAADPESPRLPTRVGVDERWYVVRLVVDPDARTLAEEAAALLFKETRLKIGKVAPDLEVELLDGTPWRMIDQRGKVVVVQFSFTGCGPCERMYPDLAELTEQLGGRLEILTIMRDPTPDSAQQGVDAGKLTWSVAVDGKPGRVCDKWSVKGFPEVYVIGPDGVIGERGVRGDELRDAIAERLPAET